MEPYNENWEDDGIVEIEAEKMYKKLRNLHGGGGGMKNGRVGDIVPADGDFPG